MNRSGLHQMKTTSICSIRRCPGAFRLGALFHGAPQLRFAPAAEAQLPPHPTSSRRR